MASLVTSPPDPLLCLRHSIASKQPPILTTSADATAASDAVDDLAIATHLHFTEPNHQYFPLDTLTRFVSSGNAVDLRSIYFAWQKKDSAIPEYITSAQQLNEELAAPGGAGGKVQNLVFVERLDLITWLETASDESEYIKPLESDGLAASAAGSAQVASGAVGGIVTIPSGVAGGRPGKPINPRLARIYNGERRMGDRNSVLRGIKPTVGVFVHRIYVAALTELGFFSHSQIRRSLPEQESQPTRSFVHGARQPTHKSFASGITQKACSTPRSHHLAFAFRFVPASHEQHQVVSRIGCLHPSGQRSRGFLQYGEYPPYLTPVAIDRPATTIAIHLGGYAGAVQAGLLVSCRWRFHNRSDLAVQVVQVAIRTGLVQKRAWHLYRMEG